MACRDMHHIFKNSLIITPMIIIIMVEILSLVILSSKINCMDCHLLRDLPVSIPVPLVIRECTHFIEQYGICDGIYGNVHLRDRQREYAKLGGVQESPSVCKLQRASNPLLTYHYQKFEVRILYQLVYIVRNSR